MFEFVTYYYDKLKDNIIWIKDKIIQCYFDDGTLNEELKEKYDDL